jgi:hypothetical protein
MTTADDDGDQPGDPPDAHSPADGPRDRRRRLRIVGLVAAPALVLALAIAGSALRGPAGAGELVAGSAPLPPTGEPEESGTLVQVTAMTMVQRAGEPQPPVEAFDQGCHLVASGVPRTQAIAALRSNGVTEDVARQIIDAFRTAIRPGQRLSCPTKSP